MLTVIGCFINQNDPWLLALASIICGLASSSTIALSNHARKTVGAWRQGWVCIAALAGGSGIWATHFLGMLSTDPGIPAGYAIGPTLMSLAIAIACSGIGLATAILWRAPAASALGGAIMGLGIAAMHYTGMAGYAIEGHLIWSPVLVALSIATGTGFATAALRIGLSGDRARNHLLGAGLLVLAICGLHAIGMTALTMRPDPQVAVSEDTVTALWLALPIALASLTILLMACGALILDLRDRQGEVHRGRLKSLANAAVEGLVICREGIIVSANDSFAALTMTEARALSGAELSRFLPDAKTRRALDGLSADGIEGVLRRSDGTDVPVELIMRPVAYARSPHFALAVRDLTARRRAERQIRFLAAHDPLTGLPNRASFHEGLDRQIEQAGATGRRLALISIDLDGFKAVNALLGPGTGDTILVRVAGRVRALLDDTQILARIGGDEFAVVTPCTHAVAAGRLAEAIGAALRSPDGGPVTDSIVTASIGIALFPDDARDRNELLEAAETALLLAKAAERGSYRFFEAAMGSEVRMRRALEKDLRRALAKGELRLVYQPQIAIGTGAVTGFEVLLRWHQPMRGYVSPAVFIPIAEESGLILEIGAWVLAGACREAAGWTAPLSVAVNVSALQIHDPDFALRIQAILAETGLAPRRLELEITETALIRDPERALVTLSRLKALGVGLAMDDFGTGYSSLSNLRLFPFDKIKIDASFIASVDSNPQAAAIVRSVLGLGAGLGLPVVAEGVETAGELAFLAAGNCHAAQGYLIGRPGPISGFLHLVLTSHPASPEPRPAPDELAPGDELARGDELAPGDALPETEVRRRARG